MIYTVCLFVCCRPGQDGSFQVCIAAGTATTGEGDTRRQADGHTDTFTLPGSGGREGRRGLLVGGQQQSRPGPNSSGGKRLSWTHDCPRYRYYK